MTTLLLMENTYEMALALKDHQRRRYPLASALCLAIDAEFEPAFRRAATAEVVGSHDRHRATLQIPSIFL